MTAILNYLTRVFNYNLKYSNFEHCKMVLVVRSDIAMGKGKTAAQCAHAAVECYRQAINNSKYQQIYESWLLQGQPKVVVKIHDEEGLVALARSARKAGLIIALIKDAGRTQIEPGTVTALGIGPGPKQVIDGLTSNLKLM
ncbi:peptidyl-tRNA hydrolase 2, mitochondrial [Calliopsis andreniformis]|uniref:peptidyl-tRNA hydrolase 2, mitochondrial n=1 Tax=Calliopsis andreniformis TaxID=337506 RepID=UPI003FCD443D